MSMMIASHRVRLLESWDPTKTVRYPGNGWEPRTLSTSNLMGRGKISVIGTAIRDIINRTMIGQRYGRRSSKARLSMTGPQHHSSSNLLNKPRDYVTLPVH